MPRIRFLEAPWTLKYFKKWVDHRVCGQHCCAKVVVALKKARALILGLFVNIQCCRAQKKILWVVKYIIF